MDTISTARRTSRRSSSAPARPGSRPATTWRKRGREFVILDSYERVGDNWRCHWDSLRLYSPALAAALPGMDVPGAALVVPDQGRDGRLPRGLPGAVRPAGPRRGAGAARSAARASATSSPAPTGRRTPATTWWSRPGPSAGRRTCRRSRASWTRRSASCTPATTSGRRSCKPGGVLVVGASHSGGDIAFEAGSAGHPVVLSGPIHGQIPFRLEKPAAKVAFPVLFFLAKHVLTMRTPIGPQDPPGDPGARRPADPGEEGRPRRVGVEMAAGPHRRRAGRPAGAGRRPGARRDERRVVHRLPAGLLLDRPADHRRRRLAAGAARRRGRRAGPLLRRAGVPVRVLLDAGRRRRPGRRVRREAPRPRGRPRPARSRARTAA